MPDSQNKNEDGQTENVPGVKTQQCGVAGFPSADGNAEEKITDERNGLEQVRPGEERISNALVPAYDIAGEIQQNGEDEYSQPDQVIEAARTSV